MTTATYPNPMLRVMGLRDFRLLFTGTGLSLLGDQFALIATPWLVLQLTDDPMRLGLVLALEGLPRAAFLLIGGAITDRVSPRRMMLAADISRMVLATAMAGVVLTGTVELWMLYVFALGFGTIAGCAVPAENSIVPMLVGKEDLQAGNSIIMGATQLAGFAGPSLAGIVIGLHAQSLTGVGYAFGIDAASFAISALCLMAIRGASRPRDVSPREPVLAAIRSALGYVWRDESLRLVLCLLAAINFLVIGPLLVGLPVIARERLPQGAVAYGMLMSAFAAGSLLGFAAAGALPRPGPRVIRVLIASLLAGFGLVLGVLGAISSTGLAFALLLILGAGNGYAAILMITWMQTRTPEHMLGRVMSFLVFASAGVVPVSQALAGALIGWNLEATLVTAGVLAVLVTLWAAFRPGFATFSNNLAAQAATAAE